MIDTMPRYTLSKSSIVLLVVVAGLMSIVILTGLASQDPDGFEWSLFEYGGVPEPESWFTGIWSFLAEGPLTDLVIGITGIFFVMVLTVLAFSYLSRRDRTTE